MAIKFDTTMTEADFTKPLLDATEERLAREARGEVDLHVEGLKDSILSRILRTVSGSGRKAA
jgi:hypothetical protein